MGHSKQITESNGGRVAKRPPLRNCQSVLGEISHILLRKPSSCAVGPLPRMICNLGAWIQGNRVRPTHSTVIILSVFVRILCRYSQARSALATYNLCWALDLHNNHRSVKESLKFKVRSLKVS